MTKEERALLNSHGWPGNVSELQHVLGRVAILTGDGAVIPPAEMRTRVALPETQVAACGAAEQTHPPPLRRMVTRHVVERAVILAGDGAVITPAEIEFDLTGIPSQL